MGPNGPTDHRQRLTAMALFMHMSEQGQCWVGQPRIAERTGFGERSVRRHVQALERDGWIQRSFVKDAGKAWRRTIYTASLPPSLAPANEMPDQNNEGAANGAPHLASAPANRVPEQAPSDCHSQDVGAAKPEEGPAISSEGAANLPSGPANEWPLNRDLEQGIEPVSRTSSDDSKNHIPSKSPQEESKKPKNKDPFDTINAKVLKLILSMNLRGTQDDRPLLVKCTGYSDRQIQVSIGQLTDRGHLPNDMAAKQRATT